VVIINALKIYPVFPPRFKPEITDKRQRRILSENGSSKNLAFIDVIVGEILFIDGYRNNGRLRGNLDNSIGDLPVYFLAVFAADDKHAVNSFLKNAFGFILVPPSIFLHEIFFIGLDRAL